MPANKLKSEKRARIETINAEVAVSKDILALIALRIQQARDRTGLDDLLSPALSDIDTVVKCLAEISSQSAGLMEC